MKCGTCWCLASAGRRARVRNCAWPSARGQGRVVRLRGSTSLRPLGAWRTSREHQVGLSPRDERPLQPETAQLTGRRGRRGLCFGVRGTPRQGGRARADPAAAAHRGRGRGAQRAEGPPGTGPSGVASLPRPGDSRTVLESAARRVWPPVHRLWAGATVVRWQGMRPAGQQPGPVTSSTVDGGCAPAFTPALLAVPAPYPP